jgi:N-acyl-phosphatidylethanolamine-hydrolysing phospholipase D
VNNADSSRRLVTGKVKSPDVTPPTVPVQKPHFLPTRETPTLRTTWLGHACYYVEFPGGLRVLFDPVFEDRCGPSGVLGPKRFTEPPCQLEDIPFIDAVVISHSHYDHLSLPSVQRIQKAHPNAQFFAPLGNKKWFLNNGIKQATEMDWWDTKEFNLTKLEKQAAGSQKSLPSQADTTDAKQGPDSSPEKISAIIGCLPSQHMAARTPFDKASTLWASWFVESGGKRVWFAG